MLKLVQKNKKNFIKQHCMWLDEVKGKNINGNMNAALNSLNLINPKKYCRDRNYLNGSVTKLSAYIQHGLLTLNTIRNHAIDQVEYAKDIVTANGKPSGTATTTIVTAIIKKLITFVCGLTGSSIAQ